jgi:transcriptional regulator with XRE-family HTH domain
MHKRPIGSANQIAKALKERRQDLNITQKQLAAYCNLSHNGISRIELGESDIKLSTLMKMSRMLGFKIVFEMEE